MKIAVSYLKTPYTKEETIKKIENTSTDYIHVDLIDGKFVGDKNFTWEEITKLLKNSQKPLDVHLMTLDLEENIKMASTLKPETISFHYEATTKIQETIHQIKSYGSKVGIAINPSTDIEKIKFYLKDIDLVLIMSVEPGRGGQSFLSSTIEKLNQLKEYQKEHNFLIEVDGGINENTIDLVKEKADIVVSGSYICESENFEQQIKKLKGE